MTFLVEDEPRYDVCLSFAGEQRPYVEQVAEALKAQGIRVFYDGYEQANLWGKDLYEHLDWVYGKAARYCILFASRDYASKVWTTHERRSAQARALAEHEEYILPVRFDDCEIPGVRATIGFVDATTIGPTELATLAVAKVGSFRRSNYVPPHPTRLYAELEIDRKDEDLVHSMALSLVQDLRRMTLDERTAVGYVMLNSCPTGIPFAPHVNFDVMCRDLGSPPTELRQMLAGIRALGFTTTIAPHEQILSFEESDLSGRTTVHHVEVAAPLEAAPSRDMEPDVVVLLEWQDRSNYPYPDFEFAATNSTRVACTMFNCAIDHLCLNCMRRLVEELDFSSLAGAAQGEANRSTPSPFLITTETLK